jgi:iron complex outermembrane recepter protein
MPLLQQFWGEEMHTPVDLSVRSAWAVRAIVATILAGSSAATVIAAESDADAAAEDTLSEVVVTGSRISRRDYNSDSPIVTVSSEALQNTSEVGIEAALNKMPQFVPGQNQFSDATAITVTPTRSVGIATANLRGLGANRTLVLLDGRRTQPANASMSVDLNTIPSAAVETVEVITGGAGSTYGADAVAGVVNFKLKRNFNGIALDAMMGETFEGDGGQRNFSALMGSNFDEGRGNAMIGLSFSKRDAIQRFDREFFADTLTDPYGAASTFLNFPGFVSGSPGNVTNSIAGGAVSQTAVNTVFGAKGFVTGDVAPGSFYFNKAATVAASTIFTTAQGRVSGRLSPGYSGDTFPGAKYVVSNVNTRAQTLTTNSTGGYLQVPLTRYSLFTNAHYNVNEHADVYMQASFDENKTRTATGDWTPAGSQWGATVPFGTGVYAPSLNGTNTRPEYQTGGIYGLNCPATGGCTNSQAFPVAPELETLLNSRGTTANSPWTLNQNTTFMPQRTLATTAQTYELLAGVRGTLGIKDWTYDFFASRGNASQFTSYDGFINALAYQTLLNLPNYGRGADYNNGRLGVLAHCTSGINPFLNTPVSQDCIDILDSNAKLSQQLGQQQAEFNVQGSITEVPAGDLRFAAGLAYRKNTYDYLPDQGMQTTNINSVVLGQFDTTETHGEIGVKEIYAEVLAPIVRDVFLVKNLELNGGYRYSDYDTDTGGVSTWKLTANWDVNDYVKVRGGRQVANRAPNIAELFQPAVFEVVTWTDHDPCSNLTRATFGNNVSNPNRAQVQTLCNQVIRLQGPSTINVDSSFVGNQPFYFNAGRDLTQGNLNLKSEEAKTWTAGLVLRSPFDSTYLNRATLAIDWYSINVEGAIATASTPYVYQECFNAFGTNATYDVSNPFCQRIIRDPNNGFWVATKAQYLNLSSRETSGVDATFDYRVDTPFFAGQTGTVNLSVNANWLLAYKVQVADTLPAFDYKNSIGSNNGAQYRWKAQTNLGYSVGPASVNLSWRYLPEVRNAAVVTSPTNTTHSTSPYHLFNLSGRWAVSDTLSVRAGVDNLFDRQPVRVGANYVPSSSGSGYTEAIGTTDVSNYDVSGRRFYVGVNAKF